MPMPTRARIYLFGLAALGSYFVWRAHKTDKVRARLRIVDRNEEPTIYIATVVTYSVMVVAFAALAIFSA